VIPLLDRLSSALTSWLAPMFGQDLRLAHDLDEVPALAPRRRLKWQQIQSADFLTLNEKRQALGYEPIDGGDMQSEQKNAIDYARVHGHPQPRDDQGRFDRDGIGDGVTAKRPDQGSGRSEERVKPEPGSVPNWDFIRDAEGTKLTGHVPSKDGKPIDKSGVTVGHGFDIGQWSEAGFDTLAIAPAEREKLKRAFRPFFGLTGEAAQAALATHPVPTVTEEQAKALFEAARGRIYDQVRKAYNRDLQQGRHEDLARFEDLPSEAQTAILSLAYQYGPDLRRRTPRYWDRVVRQDWRAAITELLDFRDRYQPRRDLEAEQLERMLRRQAGR
jgi:hypothetical protein